MFKIDCEDDHSWEKLTQFPHVAATKEALATVNQISLGIGYLWSQLVLAGVRGT